MSRRLFGFGCSFTNYRWSTWFDCLAPEFEHPQNWGQSGAGNHYIFNSIMEADQRHRFGPGDTVIVCWSNVYRDDRYIKNRWITLGGVAGTKVYTKDFIMDEVDLRGYFIRDMAMIKAAKELLQARPGVNWYFTSMIPLHMEDIHTTQITVDSDAVELYRDVLDCFIPSYFESLRPNGWWKSGPFPDDDHPSPAEHLEFLDKHFPGWVTKAETRAKIAAETANLRKDPRRSGMCEQTRL